MGVHDGHRERLRDRFIKNDLDSFNELNALELLLFYAIPRKDTNVIAHELLDAFGSLKAVFDASQQELMSVAGVGENTATLIRLVPQIIKLSSVSSADQIKVIKDTKTAAEYLQPRFMFERDEVLYILCLDVKRRVICCKEVSRGVVDSVEVNIRKIVEFALKSKASSVIAAHNHPDGNVMASVEDDITTKQILKSLSSVGIELHDHLIFADDGYISYRKSGALLLYGHQI